MPAKLDKPSILKDIRLYAEDVSLLESLLHKNHSTLNAYVRELVHNAANRERRKLGIPET